MTDSQKLDLLLQKMTAMETDIAELKKDSAEAKAERTEMQEELRKLNSRMEVLEYKENRTHRKLENLILDVKIAKRDIQKDIADLRDDNDTILKVLELRGMLSMSL